MRKTGIALTVIGAAAFAALLAWGLTFNAAQADEASPTPTATPAATGTPAVQPCVPVPLGTLSGSVTINGTPAPAGTVISVTKGGEVFGQETTTVAGQYAVNVLNRRLTDVNPPCFTDILEALTITCDGATATQHPTSVPSGISTLDLTCAAAATATPPPATQPPATQPPATQPPATAAPTATPAAPPPTGGGPGGESGFPWWPLALAAAALTAVAGLYTARRATR